MTRILYVAMILLVALNALAYAEDLSSTNAPPVGDFDGDNEVGLSDFVLFLDVFGTTTSSVGWDPTFDLDSDGAVGLSDFVMFLDNFGKTGIPDQPVIQVPKLRSSSIAIAISSTEKIQLASTFTNVRASSESIPTNLNSLIRFAISRNDPYVTDLVRRIKILYAGNTVKVLIDSLETNIENSDENLDDNTVQLGAEIKQLDTLTVELSELAEQTGDVELDSLENVFSAQVDSLNAEFSEF